MAWAFANKSAQTYRINSARFRENPADEIFNGPISFLYRPDNAVGKFATRFFGTDAGNPSELEMLRAAGARNGAAGAKVMMVVNDFNIIANAWALGDCMTSESCSASQKYVMAGEVGTGASFLSFQYFNAKSSEVIRQANITALSGDANRSLTLHQNGCAAGLLARNVANVAFGLKVAGGAIKSGREITKIYEGTTVDPSALVDGAVDVGDGASQIVFNNYLISRYKEAKALVTLAQKEGANTAAALAQIKRAGDILNVSAVPIPARIFWPRIGFGVAGGILGFIPSAMTFYQSFSDSGFSSVERRHARISGGLGMVGSAFFIASAILITPAALPLGFAFFAAGMLFLVIQTGYDNYGFQIH